MAEETKKTGMLEEDSGATSSIRVMLLAIASVTIGMFATSNLAMIVNVFIRGGKFDMVDIPTNMMGLCIAALGAKSLQRFGEK